MDAAMFEVNISPFPVTGADPHRAAMLELFGRHDSYQVPPMAMVRVPNACLIGPHLFCTDADGRIVRSSLRGYKSIARSPFVTIDGKFARWNWDAVSSTDIDGEVSVVGGKASGAFFHWMVEIIPRLVHLIRTGEAAARPIVMRPLHHRYQVQSIDRLGIRPLYVTEDVIRTAGAHFPTHTILPGGVGQITPETVTNLRSFADVEMALDPPGAGRRLYISRADAPKRRILNEDAVAARMARLGFEICLASAMSLAEQMAAFRAADIVVGQHGAGLTLTALCRPGTRVIELYSEAFLAVSPFRNIASLAGLDYHMLLCRGIADRDGGYHNGDLIVDMDQLEAVIRTPTVPLSPARER